MKGSLKGQLIKCIVYIRLLTSGSRSTPYSHNFSLPSIINRRQKLTSILIHPDQVKWFSCNIVSLESIVEMSIGSKLVPNIHRSQWGIFADSVQNNVFVVTCTAT